MIEGIIDPTTKKFVKTAGNATVDNIPVASSETAGLMSVADKKKIDEAYTTEDVASAAIIEDLFN